MSRIVPAGTITWIPSASPDVAGYYAYYEQDEEPTYNSQKVNVGLVTTFDLPLEGQEPIEGDFFYGISAYDAKGNESDIKSIQVTLDTTPPSPPIDVIYNP